MFRNSYSLNAKIIICLVITKFIIKHKRLIVNLNKFPKIICRMLTNHVIPQHEEHTHNYFINIVTDIFIIFLMNFGNVF